MDKKELLEQLEALKVSLDKDLSEKAKAEITSQIAAIEAKLTKSEDAVKLDIKGIKEDLEKANAFILEQKKKNGVDGLKPEAKAESFKSVLTKGLKEKEVNLKGYKDSRSPVNLELKTVGDLASGNFTTSGTASWLGAPQYMGTAKPAFEPMHMKDLFPTRPLSTDGIHVIRIANGEGGPTSVGVGGLKPQTDIDIVKVLQPVTKVAHYYTVPEEYLEDISWLSGSITDNGLSRLQLLEDTKILSNATGGEFGGLIQNSTAFAAPTGLALGVDLANEYDVLVAAITQLRNAGRTPNFILISNDTWAKLVLTKIAATGEYIFGAPNFGFPNVYGVPIYTTSASALAGKFIVGDNMEAAIGTKAGVGVRFYDQHASNAIYNLVTIVIEERFSFAVITPEAFVYGTFSTAKAALETA